jgi:dopachrome tautomerase
MHHLHVQVLVTVTLLTCLEIVSAQFPAVCNNPVNLKTKTCCPNDCSSGQGRGTCKNIKDEVTAQWNLSNRTVVDILANSPNEPAKNAIDSRYLWPILIFENVCECSGNFGGANGDCSECDFGWIGANCNVKKPPVIRKKFSSLT